MLVLVRPSRATGFGNATHYVWNVRPASFVDVLAGRLGVHIQMILLFKLQNYDRIHGAAVSGVSPIVVRLYRISSVLCRERENK